MASRRGQRGARPVELVGWRNDHDRDAPVQCRQCHTRPRRDVGEAEHIAQQRIGESDRRRL